MDDERIDYIINNAKRSMEIEGFVIDEELEEIGRKIVKGELKIEDYKADLIARYTKEPTAISMEEIK